MKLKLKHKIIGLALLAALLPALVMSILFTVQKSQVTSKVSDELDVLGRRNIAQIAQDAYVLCKTANDMTQQVGIKQEEMLEGVRQAIMQVRIGETGYVWVVGGTGDDQGHYIISKGGQRDGEDIWEAQDADGNLFIQSIISKALAAWEGEVSYERYPWQNPGEPEARMKILAFTYFGPWDWVIGAGVYEDDLFRARNTMESSLSSLLSWALVGGLIALGIAAVLAFFVGGEIAKSGYD